MYNQFTMDRIDNQIKELENMKKMYQSMPQSNPINNFISTNTQPTATLFEWRILNDNEDVDNLYVKNKTLFVGETTMILKDVDGKKEIWDIKKTYPIDKKDIKISELEEELSKLKEMINNEHTKSSNATKTSHKQTSDVIVDDDTKSA